ncbi:MAG: DUF5689 domain-containing protein [Bacteroidia bacterium]
MNTLKKICLLFFIATGIISCKKEFDTPPLKEIPTGNILTISDLKARYQGAPIKFEEDLSVFAVVSMDEKTGNLYKNVYVQDATGAINLRLMNAGGLYQGDSIRIYLKNTVLNRYNGMMQLDSVDVDKNIIKQKTLVNVEPQIVSISQINTNLQSKLIKLENVQFSTSELGKTYADAIAQTSQNRMLEDCDGNTIIVRTSGYANFAKDTLPEKRGSLIAIVGEFNGTIQLYIRTPQEVNFSENRCGPYLSKNFEDNNITSGGWLIKNYEGTSEITTSPSWEWKSASFSGNYFAKASAYNTGTSGCESWLVSPPVDLSSSSVPALTFRSCYNFSGPDIELYIATNYNGGAISSATWTPLPFTLPTTGGYAWTGSGVIPLTGYKTSNVRIAFKFTGSTSTSKTWEVDDIMIKEN